MLTAHMYKVLTNYHTTTLHYIRLTAFFPGQPGQAGTKKAEPFW